MKNLSKKFLIVATCIFSLNATTSFAKNYSSDSQIPTSVRLKMQMGEKWNDVKRNNRIEVKYEQKMNQMDKDALWVYMATVHPVVADNSPNAKAYPLKFDF